MSFSILDLQRAVSAPSAVPRPKVEEKIEAVEEPVAEPAPETDAGDFEFVLGRRQVASLSFVAMVVLMICVAAAYSAGKSTSPKAVVAAAPPPIARVPEPAPVVVKQEPVAAVQAPEPPLYADPKVGAVYIQMGAVEKGVAEIFAEGLRKRGLPGMVAPGPSPTVYRVLIGPLPDPASFVKAKAMVDKIGLSTFARKYP